MYGCGDLLNDYEGIGGYEAYHGELGLMYFVSFDTGSHRLVQLSMVPTQIRHLRINRAPPDAGDWLLQTLNRESGELGATVHQQPDGTFVLRFDRPESTL